MRNVLPQRAAGAAPRRRTKANEPGERRLRLLFDQAAVGMSFMTLDGRFVDANERMCEIVGFSKDELLGSTWNDVTHPGDLEYDAIIRSGILSGGPRASTWEKRYARKDGTTVWCSLTLTLLRDRHGKPTQFACVAVDINERKRSAQRLQESEALLRIAGEAARLGGWTYDESTRLFSLSDEVCSIFDIPIGTAPRLGEAMTYFSPSSVRRLRAATDRLSAVGDGFDLELEMRSHAGRNGWVRVIGQAEAAGARVVGAVQDITDRKIAEVEASRTTRALKMLSGCNEVLVRATDEKELLAAICRLCVEVGGYAMAWVGYARDDERKTIEPVAMAGNVEGYFDEVRLSWHDTDACGRSAAGQTIREGAVVIVEDLEREVRFEPFRTTAIAHGFRSVIDLPLRSAQRTFGVIGLHATDPHRPPEAEIALLEEMVADLAYGIEHVRARHDRQRIHDAVLKISAAVSARGGTEFLERLVANMAAAVGAQAAYVIRPHPNDPKKLRTLVAHVEGETRPNVDIDADGSPCGDADVDETFIVESHLGERHPRCAVANSIGARSLIGWRLRGTNDDDLATMMVFFRDPLVEVDFITSTLKIFVARAAAELERQIADARIADQASWIDRARDAIVVRDLDGRISFWNKSAERLYGWSAHEIMGRSINERLFVDGARLREASEIVRETGFWSGEIEKRRKDGSPIWVESRWSLVTDDGIARSILAIDTDITERTLAEREIEHLAYYDTLTNLPNRLLLVRRLERAVESDEYGALLFLDLDNFKTLNDTLGHNMGDLLLQKVSDRLRSCVRETDTVARLGGDEFVVMLEGLGEGIEAATVAARRVASDILAASNVAYDLDGRTHIGTPSIGVTLFARGDAPDDLLKRADLAMYQAKAAGRNAVRFFDPAMEARARTRRALEEDIRRALAADEFTVAYQPQVDDEGRVFGAEALVRWTHVGGTTTAPNDFVPVAEESGLIVPLGRRVLALACDQLVAWADRPHTARLKLSVNVSAREFRHPEFVEGVIATLVASGANPQRLVLELTESVLVDDTEVVIAKMSALREMGIDFSLDDFGTGYSSLSYLKRLPLKQLKIDRSFVRDVLVDTNDAVIARTIVALGRSLSLDVIAEGVETPEQRAFLIDAGCRSFQGYFFSRPLGARAFEAFVTENVANGRPRAAYASRSEAVENV